MTATPRSLLATTAVAAALLALGACGSDSERPEVTRPGTVTIAERTTTDPPATETTERDRPSTTESETTDPPETDPPETDPPETDPPRTDPPRTDPPETDPPRTDPPTTEEESTQTTEVETQTTVTKVTTVTTASADDATVWWPWLLAALAVIGLIIFLVMRRSGKAAEWRRRTAAAFDKSTRLATHLAALAPEGAAMVATQDAGQLAELAATLSALGVEAPDEPSCQAIRSVRDQVQVLHGVVDGIVMGTGSPSPTSLDYLREQATTLHGASARARAQVFPPTPGAGTTA